MKDYFDNWIEFKSTVQKNINSFANFKSEEDAIDYIQGKQYFLALQKQYTKIDIMLNELRRTPSSAIKQEAIKEEKLKFNTMAKVLEQGVLFKKLRNLK